MLAEHPHQQPPIPPWSQPSTTTPPVTVCIAQNTSLQCIRFPTHLARQEITWLLCTTENCTNHKRHQSESSFFLPQLLIFTTHRETSLGSWHLYTKFRLGLASKLFGRLTDQVNLDSLESLTKACPHLPSIRVTATFFSPNSSWFAIQESSSLAAQAVG